MKSGYKPNFAYQRPTTVSRGDGFVIHPRCSVCSFGRVLVRFPRGQGWGEHVFVVVGRCARDGRESGFRGGTAVATRYIVFSIVVAAPPHLVSSIEPISLSREGGMCLGVCS